MLTKPQQAARLPENFGWFFLVPNIPPGNKDGAKIPPISPLAAEKAVVMVLTNKSDSEVAVGREELAKRPFNVSYPKSRICGDHNPTIPHSNPFPKVWHLGKQVSYSRFGQTNRSLEKRLGPSD